MMRLKMELISHKDKIYYINIMAPNSQSRSGGGFFSGLFNRTVYKGNATKKAPAPARTFGEKYAPLRSLAGYDTQRRLIAQNVTGLKTKINAARTSLENAKTKNVEYESLDKAYRAAVQEQDNTWNAYTAAKTKVYALLMQRQRASKGIVDRVQGIYRHGLSGLFTRKSYAENVQANSRALEANKKALLARAKVVKDAQEEEKRKQEAFNKLIEKRNEESDKVLKEAENTVQSANNSVKSTRSNSTASNPGNNNNNNSRKQNP